MIELEKYNEAGRNQNLSPRTLEGRDDVLKPLQKFLGKKPLTLDTATSYITSLYKRNLSVPTIDLHVKVIRAYANFMEWTWGKKLVRPKLHKKPLEIIPSDTAEKVIFAGTEEGSGDNSRNKKIKESTRLCLRFMLRTGLRVTEALSLTDKSFNFEEETFNVLSKGGNWDILPLPRDMIGELKNLPPGGKLFQTTAETLNLSLRRGAKRLGITTRLHNHSLRHIFATSLLKSGIPPQIVQRLMRHKSFEITNRVYSHYVITDLALAMNSQGIVRQGLSVSEIFDNIEKSIKSIIEKDNRFKISITRHEGKISLDVEAIVMHQEAFEK